MTRVVATGDGIPHGRHEGHLQTCRIVILEKCCDKHGDGRHDDRQVELHRVHDLKLHGLLKLNRISWIEVPNAYPNRWVCARKWWKRR